MAEKDQTARGALVISTGAAIAAALAFLTRRKAIAAPAELVSLDEATMNLLIAIAKSSGDTYEKLGEVISAIEGIPGVSISDIKVQGYPPNADGIISGRIPMTIVNTPYRMPDVRIPDDFEVQIKGWPTNAGIIYVGGSEPAAVNINQAWPLLANEAIGYRVKNLNQVYVSGTVAGDFAAYTVEQRRGGG